MENIKIIRIKFTIGFLFSGFLSFSQNIYTAAGTGTPGFTGDGSSATGAQINGPVGICSDAGGNIYIADWRNHRVRKINTAGVISTFAGTGNPSYSGDGGQAINADVRDPRGVACDGSGNIYIVGDFLVRKVNTAGIISTFAGTGITGFAGDGGLAINAKLGYPEYICFDATGNAYISDFNNSRVRKVNTSGIISTYVGTGIYGNSGDAGLAVNANISAPVGLIVNAQGDLLVADYGSSCIRKVNSSGIISTIVGTGIAGYGGDNSSAINAQIASPCGLGIDGGGNLYISDYGNNRIRKVNTSGIITTIAGNGTAGILGDGGLATSASLNGPSGIVIDATGNIFISDGFNNKVREVCIGDCLAGVQSFEKDMSNLIIYPSPNNGKFKLKIPHNYAGSKLQIINSMGQIVHEELIKSEEIDVITSKLSVGFYSCFIHSETLNTINKKFIIMN